MKPNPNQPSLFGSGAFRIPDESLLEEGRRRRDRGMKQAADHAEQVHPSWQEKAYALLVTYIGRMDRPWMVEEFRKAVKDILPEPPSNRAFGGLVAKAARAGLIRQVGFGKVKNPKAHCANAAVWEKK